MALQQAAPYIGTLAGAWLLISVGRIAYRLLFHPLAKFPGPTCAAVTDWYRTYYEVWKNGAFVDRLNELHAQYGKTVVRIGPNSLHFNNPRAYADIYTLGTRFTKDPSFYAAMHQPECSLTMMDRREAKTRRDVLAPLFSRKAVLQLETVVSEKVDKLVTRVLSYAASGKPVDLHRAYHSAALDVVLDYCFARHHNVLDADDFSHWLVLAFEESFSGILVLVNFDWLYYIMVALEAIMAPFQSTPSYNSVWTEGRATLNKLTKHPELLDQQPHETIYNRLLVPQPEKGQLKPASHFSILQEADNLTAAGGDTVGNAATVGTFYVLHNPSVRNALVAELCAAWQDKSVPMTYEELEKLPYLTMVIKESLRLSHGIVLPTPRVVHEASTIAGYHVPPGTSVAMGSTFMHYNTDIFPDPREFRPERWETPDLDQYLVAFSKGRRSCLGQNLGWCELYLILGHMFRKVDMQLYNTTLQDMEYRAHLTPTFWRKHLQCIVKEQA
ncbi:cytochrome P450 [Exidia glandulosa HHB12029]|uniref:Cytochrome P450 n=1 Tax=Exidia glandulosa HHB12029 TaxID=1314781 RepID=A0A165KF78_EXIGL|nr:cytochrome P450 [Exidia glandulosa HHB12029]